MSTDLFEFSNREEQLTLDERLISSEILIEIRLI
jgi:hypothetical protein